MSRKAKNVKVKDISMTSDVFQLFDKNMKDPNLIKFIVKKIMLLDLDLKKMGNRGTVSYNTAKHNLHSTEYLLVIPGRVEINCGLQIQTNCIHLPLGTLFASKKYQERFPKISNINVIINSMELLKEAREALLSGWTQSFELLSMLTRKVGNWESYSLHTYNDDYYIRATSVHNLEHEKNMVFEALEYGYRRDRRENILTIHMHSLKTRDFEFLFVEQCIEKTSKAPKSILRFRNSISGHAVSVAHHGPKFTRVRSILNDQNIQLDFAYTKDGVPCVGSNIFETSNFSENVETNFIKLRRCLDDNVIKPLEDVDKCMPSRVLFPKHLKFKTVSPPKVQNWTDEQLRRFVLHELEFIMKRRQELDNTIMSITSPRSDVIVQKFGPITNISTR